MRGLFATLCYGMASYYTRKDSDYYWLRLKRADGTWKSVCSGIRVKDVGAMRKIQQRVAEEIQKEQRTAEDGAEAILKNWVPGWFEYHYQNAKSARRALNAWAHLSAFFQERKILHPEEVTYSLCHQYLKWRTDQELCLKEGRRLGNWNTAVTEVRVLGAIMQEAVQRGLLLANPCARLKIARRNVKEKRPIERGEQEVIEERLRDAPEWMQDSWLVGIKQGCRLSEVAVPVADIHVPNRVIPFRVKGGKIHPAPLHEALIPLIERRKSQGKKFLVDLPPSPSKEWINFFRRAGYDDLSFHCLRVTVITRFALANVTAEKAMQYVGHCTEMTHAIYRKLRPRDVAALGDFL
jgi:integrase